MIYAALRIYIPKNNGCQIFSFQRTLQRSSWKLKRSETRNVLASASRLVENTGIEPVTSCVQGRRSPS